MKHEKLNLLRKNGFNVPPYIVIEPNENAVIKYWYFLKENKKYAVRSSSSSEDSSGASFAGQFKTVLNVDAKDVNDVVKDVFNSFSCAGEYENANGIKHNDTGFVIVQEMIQSELSGIIFTANPLGILNETVIIVGNGLGENVVSDKTSTISYYYNKDDKSFISEDHTNGEISLNNDILAKLISLSSGIENIMGCYSDIEFCIKDNEIYILQARPITTLNRNTEIVLDNSNIVESYPGISLPLTQDFVGVAYHDIFYSLIKRLTNNEKFTNKFDKYLKHMVISYNWHMYYIINNWYEIIKMLPFSKKLIKIWQNMLGVKNKTVITDKNNVVPFRIKSKIIISFIKYIINTPKYMDKLNEDFVKMYDEYTKKLKDANTIEELLHLYETIRDSILSVWDITLINDMYAFIFSYLAKDKKNISSIKNLESMKPSFAIEKLISTKEKYGLGSKEYINKRENYINEYGDRCVGELKLETKTYRTNPELLDEYVDNYKPCEFHGFTASNYDSKNGFFLKRAKTGIMNREKSRLNRSKLYGLCRQIFLRIGKILEQKNELCSFRDIFYLHIDEIKNEKLDFKSIVCERKFTKETIQKSQQNTRIVFDRKPFDRYFISKKIFIKENSDKLFGTPTSQGFTSGEIIVIDNPSLQYDTKDKIIVTKSTDPGWVFMIKNAKGIIAEKGSLLSHTAIISRELKIPAVVNVENCTDILKSGDYVDLDANNGIITILNGEKI